MDAVDRLLEDWRPDQLTRVPYQVFVDAGLFQREDERIFRGPTWSFVGVDTDIPNSYDYRTSTIGRTPVVMTRDGDGAVHVLVNRCAHRGAEVVRDVCGNAKRLRCLYHAWSYDSSGALRAAPFEKGLAGQAGYPSEFRKAEHNLRSLRVERIGGTIFATFSDEAPPVRDYLGSVLPLVERIFDGREMVVLGRFRQRIKSNWKLYFENLKDAYHATLLHPFLASFGLGRPTMEGRIHAEASGVSGLYSFTGTDEQSKHVFESLESDTAYTKGLALSAPEVVVSDFEFGDTIGAENLAIFPSFAISQTANAIATRQVVPLAVDRFDLVWTLLGYSDDPPELRAKRYVHANLVGPAGYISLEDAEALESVQRAIVEGAESAYVAMGGSGADPDETPGNMISEVAIRSFWQAWRRLMS